MSDDIASSAASRLAHLPPLGWVAKRIEDGLSEFVDTLLAREFDAGRRHWQLLRFVGERPDPAAGTFVAEAATFYTGAAARQIVDDLLARGWVGHAAGPDAADDGLTLTPDGRAAFESMRITQERTWDVVLDGLAEPEYVATVTAMARMADNLDRANAPERGTR